MFACKNVLDLLTINSIKEDFLWKMKLHLGQRGNSVFTKYPLKYTNREDWINYLFNSDVENEISFKKGIENVTDVSKF